MALYPEGDAIRRLDAVGQAGTGQIRVW